MRLLVGACLAVVVLWAAGCGSDNQTCSTCPKVEGTWAITSGQPDQACSNGKAPPSSLTITRVGSTIRSTIEGNELTGTVFDTFDFTLSGATGGSTGGADAGVRVPDHVELRAKFIEGTGDGGVDTFHGTWAFTPAADAGSQTCVETRDVTGSRTQ
ncbi:MAG: hypothetical protein ACJ790_03655 [Myxococcaceae bacterium]